MKSVNKHTYSMMFCTPFVAKGIFWMWPLCWTRNRSTWGDANLIYTWQNGTDSSGVCNLECGMRCLKALSNTYIKIILARVALVCHVLQKQEKIKQTAKLTFDFFHSVWLLYLHREQLTLKMKKIHLKICYIFFSYLHTCTWCICIYLYLFE